MPAGPTPTEKPSRRRLGIARQHAGGQPAFQISLSGELDLATAPDIDARLSGAIADGHRRIAVDVRAVTFCDATALKLLAAAATALRARDGELTVYGPCPALQLLLTLLDHETPITFRSRENDSTVPE